MQNSPLKKIKESEKKAQRIIQDARDEAKKVFEQAKIGLQERRQISVKEGRLEEKEEEEKILKELKKIEEKFKQDTKLKLKKLEERTLKNEGKAIGFVIKKVLS
ncbi:hypothetical protein COY23_02845 [bacterium (Candidatus Torokbacteria) CG_4_10_14_0_2_um_filter_35_8]|nr:MAG: hypothetical protein COY23_02845 [bacterium (Candidatus Torokbacteria) CG_4_10_14_0_2_um_filter_35_8]